MFVSILTSLQSNPIGKNPQHVRGLTEQIQRQAEMTTVHASHGHISQGRSETPRSSVAGTRDSRRLDLAQLQ